MFTLVLMPIAPLEEVELWGKYITEYYLKQAEIASRMALAEPDPEKARAMHINSLGFFDKAYRAQGKDPFTPSEKSPPSIIERR